MRILDCSVCGCPIYPGHGSTFVRNDSKVFQYCSRKCTQLFKKRANPRRLKYTKAYRKTRGKELTMDSTFDFEVKRNVPVKYDRELYQNAIKAMKRIQEIQKLRQQAFYFNRMKPTLKTKKMFLHRIVDKGEHLLVSAVAKKKAANMIVEPVEEVEEEKIEEPKFKTPIKTRKNRKKIQKDDDEE
jgi:large subunit ribosomal protein L24e